MMSKGNSVNADFDDDKVSMLQSGAELLASVLVPNGFAFEVLGSGKGSGGLFAFGQFKRGERRLEFHFRYSLGMVCYHLGPCSMSHEDYMHAVLGERHVSKYPGFSNQPMDGFRDLFSDLQEHGADFLTGTDECLLQLIEKANLLAKTRPRLPE
jgi:hypothetical protein